MTHVLIISTCYDVDSSYTARWAQDLYDDLVKRSNISCFLYKAQDLYGSSKTLNDAIDRADFVVFYGHGTQNSWVALPSYSGTFGNAAAIPLVDSTTVGVLNGRKVYAGCCWSLNGLGSNYIASFPNGEFVGYQHEFGFERANAEYFKEVVNLSVSDFVLGRPAADVVRNLQREWENLRDRFQNGNLQFRPSATQAGAVAELNRLRVGSRP
jgi:hypothetical protein